MGKKPSRRQPAAYFKILALLVPREHKVEHSNAIKDLKDEQLEQAIAAIRESLGRGPARRRKVIEGAEEILALPAPTVPTTTS